MIHLNNLLPILLVLLSITSFSPTINAVPGPCLKDAFGPGPLVCTANDVSIAEFATIFGPTSCVIGTTITVGLQARTQSTAQAFLAAPLNGRYDIGYWIASDGGNARTGACFNDYLPPPLTTTPNVNPTTSPFLDINKNACGDVIKTSTTWRNIGGTTTPVVGPPVAIQMPCQDKNNDGIADVSACTSWSNNKMNPCSSQMDTLPETGSKCNCDIVNLDDIKIVPCNKDDDCPINPNLCLPNECINNTCVQVPVICPPPTDICHTQGTCNTGTGLCSNPAVVCDTPSDPFCQIVPGTCVLPNGCTYANQPDGTICPDGTCQNGHCIPGCSTVADCPCLDCKTLTGCVAGICQYSDLHDTPCGADNICFEGTCVECIEPGDCPGANACNIATCDADKTCQYAQKDCNSSEFGGGDEIKCTIDCCDPAVQGGCVSTPSNDECMILDDECNVGFCDLTGNCSSEPLNKSPCGDPSNCTAGICILGPNDRATCDITFTCTAPDTCSTATCDGAGTCTISSTCACPEFCNDVEPSGSCLQCDETHPCLGDLVCDGGVCVGCQTADDCKGAGECTITDCIDKKCRFRPDPDCPPAVVVTPVPVLAPAPVPVPTAVPVAAPVPVKAAPVPPVINAALDEAPGDIAADLGKAEMPKGPQEAPAKKAKRGWSCASTSADMKDLWPWLLILFVLRSLKKRGYRSLLMRY